MILICPQHTRQDLERFLEAFDDLIAIVMGRREA
jgi:hypothetical protein